MAVIVAIPTSFRRATGNRDRVEGASASCSIDWSDLKGLVRDETGQLHRHINIYVNSETIDALQGLDTRLQDGDEVAIIPALAGGGGRLAHPG